MTRRPRRNRFRSPSDLWARRARYRQLTHEFGTPYYARIDAPATGEQKARLRKLAPDSIKESSLAGEPIAAVEVSPAEPVKDNLVAFARAVRGGAAYPITGDQLIANIALLEAVFASALSGQIAAVG